MTGLKLEEVTSFKYLEATLCKDSTCSAEICIRIALAMTAMARLNGLTVQHRELHKHVQVVLVSCHLHLPLWLSMDAAC